MKVVLVVIGGVMLVVVTLVAPIWVAATCDVDVDGEVFVEVVSWLRGGELCLQPTSSMERIKITVKAIDSALKLFNITFPLMSVGS